MKKTSLAVFFICLALTASALASKKPPALFENSQTFKFFYDVEVPKIEKGLEASLWVPYPTEDQYQKVLSFKVSSPIDWKLKKDVETGNRMVYLTWVGDGLSKAIRFEYKIKRLPSVGYKNDLISNDPTMDPEKFRSLNQWIQVNSQIKREAKTALGSETNPKLKIKKLYHHVVKIMHYNKDGTGWGKGDPIWACNKKRGNCTDFHSLYIAMARNEGLAARFNMGVPVPAEASKAEVKGYHCWAEVYDPRFGWVPFDASEAKKSGKTEAYFGKLPSDRVQFSTGRDLVLIPPQKAAKLNYFIYPYVEVSGEPLEGIKKKFSYERL